MARDTVTVVPFLDGTKAARQQNSTTTDDNIIVPQTALRTNGLPVEVDNPLPIAIFPSHGTYQDASVAVTTAGADIFAANPTRVRIKLINTDFITPSGGTGIVMWARWGTKAAAPAQPHGIGSFPIFPGGGIDDQGPGLNTGAINIVAESGSPILLAEQY